MQDSLTKELRVSLKQAAGVLGISPKMLKELHAKNKIRGIQVGTRYWIYADELQRLCELHARGRLL